MIKLTDSDNESNIESESETKLNDNKQNIESELSVESNIINNEEEEKKQKTQSTCGAINFTEKLSELTKDSFDESSEYSYVSIPEDKPDIDYFYYIAFSVGLILLYIFYNGNLFLTFAEFILNCIYPYMYVPIKLYMCKKIIITKLKSINLD